MKVNPCRYCSSALEYKNRHFRGFSEACYKCSFIKEHEKYLKSKRMFERGEKINSFDELMKQQYVFVGYVDRAKHIEAIKSWQLRIVLDCLEKGSFYKANKKKSEE